MSCGALVNSAGAWALKIAERFGEMAPVFPAGPPQFVTEPFPYMISPSVQAIDGSVIFRQIPRGNIILAGYPRTAADPVNNRAPVPPFKTLAAMQALARAAPVLAQCHVIRVWSGIEAHVPDLIPVIGPGVGLCLSEMIVDGATQTPLEPFSIGRFRSTAVVSEKFRREFD